VTNQGNKFELIYFSEIVHFIFTQLGVKAVLLYIIGQTNEEIVASVDSEYFHYQ